MLGPQDVEHALETLFVDDVANTDEIEVHGRHTDDQIGLRDDAENEVVAVLTFDGSGLDVFNDCCAVIRVDNGFADRESHKGSTFPR